MAKKKKVSAKDLVAELEDLYLREGNEMTEKGVFQRVKPSLPFNPGHVDKDTAQLVRIKDIILELKKVVK